MSRPPLIDRAIARTRRTYLIRLGRIYAVQLAGLGLLAVLLVIRGIDPAPVERARLEVFDLYQQVWPRAAATEAVLVVGIDEASLAELGQWPWPRTVVAALVRRLGEAGAAAIGIDAVFAEADRTSPPVAARELPGLPGPLRAGLAALPGHDEALAAAMARAPVVLGEASLLTPGSAAAGRPPTPVAVLGPDPAPFLQHHPGRLRNLPVLEAAARGLGNTDLVPEADGKARRIGLLAVQGGRLVPAFAVELVRVAQNATTLLARTSAAGLDQLRIGERVVRTDGQARVWVRYAAQPARHTVSAREVLAGLVPAERIAGRIVLVGAVATGLGDMRTTALGQLTPGVEVHAQLIETILAGTGLIRPAVAPAVELLLTLGIGLLVLLVMPRAGPLAALALSAGVIGPAWLGSILLYLGQGLLIDPLFPSTGGVLVLGTCAYLHYVQADRGRRRAAKRLAELRQEGVVAARMQRAILPKRFPVLPGLSIHGEMHPALDVGGDFYDAFELEDGRLAILVADVSGKGMGAALFMAVARTVLRSTAGGDAGLCLERANTLLAGDNEAMMFVTLFYGVLDPSTGVLDYANAGHNPPVLVSAAGVVTPLPPTGGVALGVIEDLPFADRRLRLEPGDALVLYTDGITEAFAADGQAYGEERLHRQVAASGGLGAEALVRRVVADVQAFTAGAAQSDDITCLAITFAASEYPRAA